MQTKSNVLTRENPSNVIKENKALMQKYFDAAFINFDADATRPLVTEEYIQHNPLVPSGADPFLGMLAVLKEAGMKFHNQRVIADDHIIVTHNMVNEVPMGYGNVVTFDIWRVEDGKLAEHWDNVTPRAEAPNPSGRTQVDGYTEIEDFEKTDDNKALVISFIEDVLVGGDVSKITNYISSESYIQHNVDIGDGIDGLKAALAEMAKNGVEMKYEKMHFAVAEGNFVFAASEGIFDGKKMSFFDLFRVADNLIVEHWDVLEEIPAEMAHGNGKF